MKDIIDVSPEIKSEIDKLSAELNYGFDKQIPYSNRYLSIRNKIARNSDVGLKPFGKSLDQFKIGDIVGSVSRNTDITSYKILDITPTEVKMIGLSYMFPKAEYENIKALGNHWELINPKQPIMKNYENDKVMRYKSIGDNPAKFKVDDVIVDNRGVQYRVVNPDKKGMALLENLSDTYRKGEIEEWNAHSNPQFKLVKSGSSEKKVSQLPVNEDALKKKAFELAKSLIRSNVLRGDDYSWVKGTYAGKVTPDGWVQIGGSKNGKNIGNDKILVQKLKDKEVNIVFPLKEVWDAILKEKETPKSKTTNKDLQDALAGAKAYLKYATGKEQSDIKAYIRGLEILLK